MTNIYLYLKIAGFTYLIVIQMDNLSLQLVSIWKSCNKEKESRLNDYRDPFK